MDGHTIAPGRRPYTGRIDVARCGTAARAQPVIGRHREPSSTDTTAELVGGLDDQSGDQQPGNNPGAVVEACSTHDGPSIRFDVDSPAEHQTV
jgi:hypothetical protein